MADDNGDIILATIEKNKREVLQIRRTSFNGVELLDCRCWLKSVAGGDPTPTKKGLTLRPETWREIIPELQAALDE